MPTRGLFLFAVLCMSGTLSGCAYLRGMVSRPVPPPPAVLADDAPLEQIVAHLNENTNKLRSWRSMSAKVSTRGAGGIPLPSIGATIAVEAPRNFRLVARSPVANEADFGSNQEQFWFWTRQNNDEKRVFTARHDEDSGRMQGLRIPFQPDWVMEVMGVIPIDIAKVRMQPPTLGSHTVTLIEDRTSPEGYLVRKATLIDLQNGVVHEHGLYNSQNRLIAKAVLSNYSRRYVPGGAPGESVQVPMRIDIHWPEAKLDMTLVLSQDVEVNPPRFPPSTWTIPDLPGYSITDLSG